MKKIYALIIALGLSQIGLGAYLLSREKVAPKPQKYACEIKSNGMWTTWELGENVKLVRVD